MNSVVWSLKWADVGSQLSNGIPAITRTKGYDVRMEALSVLPMLTFFLYWFFYFNVPCSEIEVSFIKSGFFLLSCSYISGEVTKAEIMTGRNCKPGRSTSF